MSDFLPMAEYLLKWCPVALLAFLVIRWLTKQFEISRDRSDKRAEQQMARCEADKLDLAERITQVEDRLYNSLTDILRSTVEALATNARAFERLTKIETDRHPAIKLLPPTDKDKKP